MWMIDAEAAAASVKLRKWLIWTMAAFAASGLATQLIWVIGTHSLVAGLDRWEAQARAQGWRISEGSRFTSGWPFMASITVSDMAAAGGEHVFPGGVDWTTGRTTLSVSLLSPFTLTVRPEGQQMIRLAHMKQMVLNADHIEAEVPLLQTADAQASLVALGLTGGDAGSGHPQDVRLESLQLQVRMRPREGGGLAGELTFALRGIGLPDIGHWPLGDTIAAASGTIRLSSPDLPSGLGAHGEAAAWREGGGQLLLQAVALRWGPLGLHGEAQLGLDERLQPAGTGKADVSGLAPALDALVDAGVIAAGIGATGKAVLSVMPSAPNGAGLRLPFVLRNNTLSVGPIPLARLRDVIW